VREHRDFKFGMRVDDSKSQPTDDKLSLKGRGQSRDLCKFWEIIGNISEMVHGRDKLQRKTKRKSRMAYRMARLPMTLSDAEGHFCCFKAF